MQAQFDLEHDVVVVRLSGRVDVETAEPFRKICFDRLLGQNVVFDFEALGFVGSTGILPFVDVIRDFGLKNEAGFKLSGMSSEFKRVFSSTLEAVEIFDHPIQAVQAFLRPAPQLASVIEEVPIRDGQAEEN